MVTLFGLQAAKAIAISSKKNQFLHLKNLRKAI